jgi:hypothetical protein
MGILIIIVLKCGHGENYLCLTGCINCCHVCFSQRCDVGHYRDTSDMSTSLLGVCRKCPCNNNEESCTLGVDLRVTCNCKPGFGGRNCDNVGEC